MGRQFFMGQSMNEHFRRKPSWLKASLGGGERFKDVIGVLKRLNLHTVCQEAACPNLGECWGRGTATFMILGDVCSRSCRFCNVASGVPGPVDEDEPFRIAEAVKMLSLRYCVITSVTRDDLTDGGAGQFAATVEAIKNVCPETVVEVLIPDFEGSEVSLQILMHAWPDVLAHNVETVERLTPEVRDRRTSYRRSLSVLKKLNDIDSEAITKSGLMVGLGETEGEIKVTMEDLLRAGCDMLTIGQYLQPSKECVPVNEYISPETFDTYKRIGEAMGFQVVASGPLVRSSYLADHFYEQSASAPTRGRPIMIENGK
jgi:lipoic acid synthetase